MKRISGLLLGLVFLVSGVGVLSAQDMSGATPPPKVLVLYREFLKPGKNGMTHEKSESAFVQAVTKAKWPTHYFAADSLSGHPRSLFFFGYDSFAAWEKDDLAAQNNPALASEIDRAGVADGELQADADQTVMTFDEDESLRANVDIAHMRYFEISIFQVRAGHQKDWEELVKLYKAGYEKVPDVKWATFDVVYAQSTTNYVVFNAMKSASEIDQEDAQFKAFKDALGEDGMKKLRDLEAAAIESSQTNLFMFNPRMSYPADEWVKADPDFWKPKKVTPMKAPEKAPIKAPGL